MANSLRASNHGLLLADRARRQMGYLKSEKAWIEAAEIAPASLRRFWLGEPVGRDKFLKICAVIGLDWEAIADIDTTEDLGSVGQRMKKLFVRTTDFDPVLNPDAPKVDEETISTLCYGWLYELQALVVKAVETENPQKTFFEMTQTVIHKISTLFQSQPEAGKGCFVEVKVKDAPGSLHQVTGVFKDKAINISQLHIVPDGEGWAILNIYGQPNADHPISEKAKDDLVIALEKLSGIVDRAEVRKVGEPSSIT